MDSDKQKYKPILTDTPGPGAYYSELEVQKNKLTRKNSAPFGLTRTSTRENHKFASDNLNIRLVGSQSGKTLIEKCQLHTQTVT